MFNIFEQKFYRFKLTPDWDNNLSLMHAFFQNLSV